VTREEEAPDWFRGRGVEGYLEEGWGVAIHKKGNVHSKKWSFGRRSVGGRLLFVRGEVTKRGTKDCSLLKEGGEGKKCVEEKVVKSKVEGGIEGPSLEEGGKG